MAFPAEREPPPTIERIRHHVALPAGGLATGPLRIAAEIVLPAGDATTERPVVFFCLPGGGMSKRYFDLGDATNRRFSFAEAMAERGWITIAFDPPGVGESTRPEDGFAVTPELMTAAYDGAARAMMAALRTGLEGRPPIREFLSVGVGHSMGAMAVTCAQANAGPFDALILMGSGPYGLIEHLPPPLRPLAGDPARARTELVERMREAGMPAYVELRPSEVSRAIIGRGDPEAREALRAARAVLIAVPGTFVMIPKSWAPEAARVAVPLMLVFGDADICEEPRAVPAWFGAAPDITLLVLPETAHNHFVYPSIGALTGRIAEWIKSLSNDSGAVGAGIRVE